MNAQDPQPRQRKGIYLLPNLFTTGTLFGGFLAIVSAMNGNFGVAAMAILGATIADALDGRIARMTNTQTDFGKEYDSLCDMVAFGVATSVVMYAFSLHHLAEYRWLGGKLGWVVAFTFTACTALRLARFNVMMENRDRPPWQGAYFTGVPAPAGAFLVLLPVYLGFLGIEPDSYYASIVSCYTLLVAFLLVSNLPVWSGKTLGARIPRAQVIPLILGVVFYVAMLATYTWLTLTLSVLAYLAFLPYSLRMWRKQAARHAREAEQSQ